MKLLKGILAYAFLAYVAATVFLNVAVPTALTLLLGCSLVAFLIVGRKRVARRAAPSLRLRFDPRTARSALPRSVELES
jgi:hypothetical protein